MVAMTTTEEPILSRLDRLDIMLRQLEEIKGSRRSSQYSPKTSSCASSSPSSGTLTSDCGQVSSTSDYFSSKSLEKHCRPIESVVMETDAKGTLIERLDHVEERVLKLCLQLEEELEAAERMRRRRKDDVIENVDVKEVNSGKIATTDEASLRSDKIATNNDKKKKKKGFKQLVKQCVLGQPNTRE